MNNFLEMMQSVMFIDCENFSPRSMPCGDAFVVLMAQGFSKACYPPRKHTHKHLSVSKSSTRLPVCMSGSASPVLFPPPFHCSSPATSSSASGVGPTPLCYSSTVPQSVTVSALSSTQSPSGMALITRQPDAYVVRASIYSPFASSLSRQPSVAQLEGRLQVNWWPCEGLGSFPFFLRDLYCFAIESAILGRQLPGSYLLMTKTGWHDF